MSPSASPPTFLLALVCAAACATNARPDDPDGAAIDARFDDGGAPDPDGGGGDAAASDATVPFDPGPEPTTRIEPVPGELTITQLELPPGITFRMGESAIVVGPDGTMVLIDVGNSPHDDEVRAAVRRLNTEVLVPARGFAARAPLQVEWVVLTHFHGDHIGALGDLLDPAGEPLQVTRGIVTRGLVDLGPAIGEGGFQRVCERLRASPALHVPVCAAAATAPCDPVQFSGTYPAQRCDGLFRGDLASASDDGAGAPSFLPLGGGARLVLVAANGFVSDGQSAVAAAPFGHEDSNQENARSLVGLIEHGAFRYHFAGDLTGRGDTGSPDLESHLAAVAGIRWYGPRGVDVVHSHHHARRNANNSRLVDLVTPRDGRARNVVAGINEAYLGSPYAEVLTGFADGDRLAVGWIWATDGAAGGAVHPRLRDAGGPVVVQTVQGGRGYRVQAAGAQLYSRAYPSVAAE